MGSGSVSPRRRLYRQAAYSQSAGQVFLIQVQSGSVRRFDRAAPPTGGVITPRPGRNVGEALCHCPTSVPQSGGGAFRSRNDSWLGHLRITDDARLVDVFDQQQEMNE